MIVTHPVLFRQLKRLKISEDQVPSLSQWHAILESINENYQDADKGQYLSELSINISSREMLEKNRKLSDAISQLQAIQNQLIQSEKMATIGQLSAGVAHEINNPLSFSLSNIGVLQKRLVILLQLIDFYKDLSNQYPDIAITIDLFMKEKNIMSILADFEPIIAETKEGLMRIKEIVKNLNKFSDLGKQEMNPIDINSCLKSAIEIMKNKLNKKCDLHIDLGTLPEIIGIYKDLKPEFALCFIHYIFARFGLISFKISF